jgi:hypothetical protein
MEPANGVNLSYVVQFYNVYRQWLWEFYQKVNTAQTLTSGNGLRKSFPLKQMK